MGQPVTESEVKGRGRARHAPETKIPWPAFRRPMWLLPMPKLLSERDGLPRRRGPLRLLGEAERIETGWWDGVPAQRDYFVAQAADGALVWVYRDRWPQSLDDQADSSGWYLHGRFG